MGKFYTIVNYTLKAVKEGETLKIKLYHRVIAWKVSFLNDCFLFLPLK